MLLVAFQNDLIAHSWQAPKMAAKLKNPVNRSAASVETGKELYLQSCSHCHGSKLTGNSPTAEEFQVKPPNLIKRAKHHSDGDFFWKIQNGKGEMPAFKGELSDIEIWHIINFMKHKK